VRGRVVLWLVGVTSVALGARTAEAQIIRRPPQRTGAPTAYASASIGLYQLATVNDGTTQSTWNFGDAAQWRVSLEKPLQGTSAIGVAATFARVPLTYRSFGSGTGCASCDADASVTQILAMFHNGGSTLGFYQVLEIAAGATAYSSFRQRDTGTRLPPTSPDFDLTFSFGYGFGFGLTQNLQMQIVQDFGLALHQSTGLAGGESRTAQLYVTRIGARYALGR
jgi:hypothetical protein